MPELKLKVRRSTVGDGLPVAWVALDGFIDASTVLSFENTLEVLHREDKGTVVLDFASVLYANSTAIGTILNYRNLLMEEGRELLLMQVNPQVLTTFELLGLTAVVPCLPDEETVGCYLASAPAGERDPEAFVVRSAMEKAAAASQGVAQAAPLRSVRPESCNVMMIVPEENRFTDVTKMRLLTPHGRFHIVTDCTEALHDFDEIDPDLIVLEDPMHGSEDFLWAVKTEKGKSVVPVIKLYWTGTDIESRREFKIWEDDFLIEPFELMELFMLGESELKRIPEDRKVLLHQTHIEFRTREGNIERAKELGRNVIEKAGLSAEGTTAMTTAFAEAMENAARHGHRYAPEKCIDVVFLLDREKLQVTVTDEGRGFDYQAHLARLAESGTPDEERLRQSRGDLGGLGISLMQRCTDQIEYLGNGSAVRLTRRL